MYADSIELYILIKMDIVGGYPGVCVRGRIVEDVLQSIHIVCSYGRVKSKLIL